MSITSGYGETIDGQEFYFDLEKSKLGYHLDINGKFNSMEEVEKIFRLMKYYFKDYHISSDNLDLYNNVLFCDELEF